MSTEKVICNKSDLVNIANSIRTKLGVTDTYYVSELSNAIDSISTGVQLPTLTNPGTALDLISGKELIDQDGNVVTGTIPTKTSSDLTSSGATVTVPSGYYASSVSKSVSTVTQATPSISVNSSGLITASTTQSEGYVTAGTKSATQQLTKQLGKTVTPGTSDVVAVESERYTTGAVYVKGDRNLTADNIKSGTSIFGVTGSYAGNSPKLQSKSVTYTSNGTATITPDEGYDGLSSVDVAVNVSGGGGSSEYEECIVQFKGTIYSGGSLAYVILKNGTPQIANQVISSTITLNKFSSLHVLKNCLFVVNNGNETFSVEGNVSYLNTTEYGYVPFFVKGDCKINFS